MKSSDLWFLIYIKKCIFCNSVLTSAKKSYSTKAIYIHASERSRYKLSENGIVSYATTYAITVSEILRFEVEEFCWISAETVAFDILMANIPWTLTQNPINHIIFWKIIMRTCRCICVNCVNRLSFLAEVSTRLQEMHILGQFKHHNSGNKREK